MIPRPRKSDFHYRMHLLFRCMTKRLLKHIPHEMLKKMTLDEQGSMLLSLLDRD